MGYMMFKKFKLLKIAALSLAIALPSTVASAATLFLTGGNDVNLPNNFTESAAAGSGLSIGDTVKAFDSNSGPGAGLGLTSASWIRFDYLGSEAAFTNEAIELAGFGVLFDNKTATPGVTSVTVALSPGAFSLLPFKFTTSGNGGKEAVNGNIENPLSIAYSPASNDGTSFIALFGDGAGDADYEDLVVRISVVPLPPAVVLFGAALAGLGWLGRRRKGSSFTS